MAGTEKPTIPVGAQVAPRTARRHLCGRAAQVRANAHGHEDFGLDRAVRVARIGGLLVFVRRGVGQRGIVLRSCGNYPGLDGSWYRTAVRTENENRQLLALLAETLPEVAQ